MRTKTLKWTKDQSKIRRNSLPHRISSFEGGRELLLTELSLAAYLLTLLLAISKHSSISHATGRILLFMYCTHTHARHTYILLCIPYEVTMIRNDNYDYEIVYLKKKKRKERKKKEKRRFCIFNH